MPDPGDDTGRDPARDDDIAAMRGAATVLRERAPRHLAGPLGEYSLFATAKLLDAIAAALEHRDPVCDDVRVSAMEIARHVRDYPPPEPYGRP